jgi:Tfp pilus assembly major pilin PilA
MKNFSKNKGITLIALIITIIVLLILAGVSINMVLGDNGVVTKALNASEKTKTESAYEAVSLAWGSCEMEYEDAWSTNQSVKRSTYFTKEKMNEYLNSEGEITEDFTYNEDGNTALTYKTSDGTEYMLKVDKTGKVSENVVYVNIDGKEVAITRKNLWQYLGRKVTNYTGATDLKITEEDGTSTIYTTVSSIYDLFYIDFDNDYGDGVGTIYLKAEITDAKKSLKIPPSVTTNNKYLILNRKWKLSGTTTLDEDNQKAVAWLLEPDVWDCLKDTTLSSNINYVVGAPSLEMYVDSYNTYLTGYNTVNSTAKLQNVNNTEAQRLKCEYVKTSTTLPADSSSTYSDEGYIIGFEGTDENMIYGTR